MKKDCYFPDFDGPGWPAPGELKKYFLDRGRLWISPGGNDHWGLEVQGLYGTGALPRRELVNVKLGLIGSPKHGVTLQYRKWDGRIQQVDTFYSKGDLSLMREFVLSLHDDLYCIGLFIPFELAWKAVKEFMESDGELPTSIEWVAGRNLPPGTFPQP